MMSQNKERLFLLELKTRMLVCSLYVKNVIGKGAFNDKSFFSTRTKESTYIAGLHVPKQRFFLAVLFERFFFFFGDSRRKRGFQPVKSLYFYVGQQKKKELLEKETEKKNRHFGTCIPASTNTNLIYLFF